MMLAMLISVALQAPPAPKAEPAPPPAAVPKAAAPAPPAPPKPETLDEQIKRALAHHPDLRIAQIQVELAQAKLEQERQKLMQRITTARATRDAAHASRDIAAKLAEMTRKVGGTTETEKLPVEEKLALAQEKLAVAEAELTAATGGQPQAAPGDRIPPPACPAFHHMAGRPVSCNSCHAVDAALDLYGRGHPPAAPDDFRANLARMLDERITPAKKTGNPRELLAELLSKAAGGKPLPVVRVPMRLDEKMWKDVGNHTLQGETETLGAWLQQLTDAVSGTRQPHEPGTNYTLYVRDYGLLLAPAAEAPAGALTVAEFWQRARAEKAAKEKPAPKK